MQIKELVTHEGHFHADDVMAGAVLTTLYPNAKLIRSRSPEMITTSPGRIVWDVGHGYQSDQNLFDHHQESGAGARTNGVPYASFGLVWLHFGKDYLKKIGIPKENIDSIWSMVDEKFVQPLDAHDTGYAKMLDPLDFSKAVSQRIPNQRHFMQDNKWIAVPENISESDYYQGYAELLPHARKRLFDYSKYLLNLTIKYDSKNLKLISTYILSLAIKKLANPNLNINNYISAQKIKKVSLGLSDIKVPRINDLFKAVLHKILLNTGVDKESSPVIERRILRHFVLNQNLFSNSATTLMSMIQHSVLSHVNMSDDQLTESVQRTVAFITFFIKNYITSAFYASTGHQMVNQEIEKYLSQNNLNGILILPGGAEYVTVVHTHNKKHPENLIKTVIYPYAKNGEPAWNMKHITLGLDTYDTYRKIPPDARGKIGDDIAEGLGLPNMKNRYIFSHNNGHLLVAKDLDAALVAARKSIEVH